MSEITGSKAKFEEFKGAERALALFTAGFVEASARMDAAAAKASDTTYLSEDPDYREAAWTMAMFTKMYEAAHELTENAKRAYERSCL